MEKGQAHDRVQTTPPPAAQSRHRPSAGHALRRPPSQGSAPYHKRAPADVAVNERGVPKFVPAIIEQSWCTSPAALCVELADAGAPAHLAGSAEFMKLAELGAELSELEAELAELFK